MVDQGPEPSNPLEPDYPSEVPFLPTSGTKGGPVVLLLVFLAWAALKVLQWLLYGLGPD